MSGRTKERTFMKFHLQFYYLHTNVVRLNHSRGSRRATPVCNLIPVWGSQIWSSWEMCPSLYHCVIRPVTRPANNCTLNMWYWTKIVEQLVNRTTYNLSWLICIPQIPNKTNSQFNNFWLNRRLLNSHTKVNWTPAHNTAMLPTLWSWPARNAGMDNQIRALVRKAWFEIRWPGCNSKP